LSAGIRPDLLDEITTLSETPTWIREGRRRKGRERECRGQEGRRENGKRFAGPMSNCFLRAYRSYLLTV